MDVAARTAILTRYRDHACAFDTIALRREHRRGGAPLEPVYALAPELPQEPTMREIETLELVALGLGNCEIGQRLNISEETVKSRVRLLLVKLPARNRTEPVAVGFRRGLIG
jgi:DNA-binding NarL/FixJ family response regulator